MTTIGKTINAHSHQMSSLIEALKKPKHPHYLTAIQSVDRQNPVHRPTNRLIKHNPADGLDAANKSYIQAEILHMCLNNPKLVTDVMKHLHDSPEEIVQIIKLLKEIPYKNDGMSRYSLLSTFLNNTNNNQIKMSAIEALVKHPTPITFIPLVEHLEDGATEVRKHAALQLSYVIKGEDRVVEALCKRLQVEQDQDVISGIVFSLSMSGTTKTAVSLINAFKKTNNPNLRNWIIDIIGSIGDGRAVEPLTELRKRSDKDTQKVIDAALRKILDRVWAKSAERISYRLDLRPFATAV